MTSRLKFVRNAALLLMVFAVPAWAGSINSYTFTTTVAGVQNTTVTGTFIYNTSTGMFSTGSLAFKGNSVFGGLHGSYNKSESGLSFVLNVKAGNITLQYLISLNPQNLNQFTASGTITRSSTTGTFSYALMPEGGTPFAYLISAGVVIFGGILLTGFRRRTQIRI